MQGVDLCEAQHRPRPQPEVLAQTRRAPEKAPHLLRFRRQGSNASSAGYAAAPAAPAMPASPESGMEWDINRPGSDFSNFNLPAPNPELCRDRCAQDPKCKAWTYVKPNTVQGPNPSAGSNTPCPERGPTPAAFPASSRQCPFPLRLQADWSGTSTVQDRISAISDLPAPSPNYAGTDAPRTRSARPGPM